MQNILITFLTSMCFGLPVFAQDVFWMDTKCSLFSRCSDPGKRYHAYPARSLESIPGILANASRETAYSAKGIYFPRSTIFAAFKFLPSARNRDEILVLSESGIWAFVKKSFLEFPLKEEETSEIKKRLSEVHSLIGVRTNRIYNEKIRSCSAEVKRTIGGSLNIKSNVNLGIAKGEISAELSASYETSYPKGYNILISRFLRREPEGILEIQAYEECGTLDLDQPDFRYDVFINGQVKKLRPESYTGRKFPLDRGKPVISCIDHYEDYSNYLKDVHEISDDWIPVVVAMTSRWRSFESTRVCEPFP